MADIQDLVERIEDELSTDIWYVYGGGRHFAAEAIIGKVVLSLACTYIASFLGIKDLAEKHRRAFTEFIRKLRDETVDEGEIRPSAAGWKRS